MQGNESKFKSLKSCLHEDNLFTPLIILKTLFCNLKVVWDHVHITVLPRAPTNSARDAASLVSTPSIQRATSFVQCSVKTTNLTINDVGEVSAHMDTSPHIVVLLFEWPPQEINPYFKFRTEYSIFNTWFVKCHGKCLILQCFMLVGMLESQTLAKLLQLEVRMLQTT
jgi:hypothetical protein